MNITRIFRCAAVVIAFGMMLNGCAWYIEPQERALINIVSQIDLNHQAALRAHQAPADCVSSTVDGRFTTTCTEGR
jgi:hypothetical protein